MYVSNYTTRLKRATTASVSIHGELVTPKDIRQHTWGGQKTPQTYPSLLTESMTRCIRPCLAPACCACYPAVLSAHQKSGSCLSGRSLRYMCSCLEAQVSMTRAAQHLHQHRPVYTAENMRPHTHPARSLCVLALHGAWQRHRRQCSRRHPKLP